MSRTNPPNSNSFFAAKSISLRTSTLSGRSSPSSSLHSAPGGVATFISSRNHRPPPFQQRRHPTDPGSSDEPDESGGVGVGIGTGPTTPHYRRYESDDDEDDDDDDKDTSTSSVPPAPEEDDDTRSGTSRASTPRQRPFPLAQQAQQIHAQKQQQSAAMRIPDFQQMFAPREEDDVFEDDKTPSFDDTMASQPVGGGGGGGGGRMEHMRLPLPMGVGDAPAPAPWGKREGSAEVVEIKPEAFLTQQQQQQQQQQQGRSGFERVADTEMRLEVAAYDDNDEEEEVRGGHGGHGGHGKRAPQPPPPASESEYRHEMEDSYTAKQSHEEEEEEEEEDDYYTNDYTDEDGSDYDERDLQKKAGPGPRQALWSDASPTMSSRAWSRAGTSRSKGSPENVPPQRRSEELRYGGGVKGKGKSRERERERKDQTYGAQRLDFRPPKPTVLPLAVRRPVSDPVLDLQLSPRARNLSLQSAATNTEIAVIPERKSKSKSKDEQPRRMITTSTTDIDLHNLLPLAELATIRTFPDLLTHLSALRAKSYTTIPATQLPGEIDELARSYYPHDPRVPERFFNSLDDRQHAAAGEYILGRKREMERQLEGVVAKRRRVVEGMVGEVAEVAEVRVRKLGRTEERREVLKGGVGRMLREAGLWS